MTLPAEGYTFIGSDPWLDSLRAALDDGAKPGTEQTIERERQVSDETIDRTKLPIRRPPFSGVANQTLGGSQPGWEQIGHGAKELKSALTEAQAGMGG
jgi:hypothetical protein